MIENQKKNIFQKLNKMVMPWFFICQQQKICIIMSTRKGAHGTAEG